MKYRRAGTLVLYWHEGELTAQNYLRRSSKDDQENAVALDPLAVAILDRLTDWTDEHQIAEDFPDYSAESVADALASLAQCGLLTAPDSAETEDHLLQAWSAWGEEARFFHFATKNAEYLVGRDEEEDMQYRREHRAASGPPPAIFKTYPDARRIYLTRALMPLEQDFGATLINRRTHRQFTGAPVDARTLSTLLHYTFAPMLICDADAFGPLLMKTSPSGGARHELEGYVVVLDVESIPPGLYHYNADSHALELLSTDINPQLLQRLTYGISMPPASAFLCVVTAIFKRTMYKYRHPRNYRATLLGAGHLGQTFVLTATALGLGAWQTIMFRDDEFEQAMGLDGYTESALYLLGAGHPVTTSAGLPPDLIPAGPISVSGLVEESSKPTTVLDR